MMHKFESAIDHTLQFEGGYVNHPNDPGGQTKFGISSRSYPNVDIAKLTKEEAVQIYRRDFWERYGYDAIHYAPLAAKVFDFCVVAGSQASHKALQRALLAMGKSVKLDGIIGARTLAAVNSVRGALLLVAYKVEMAYHFKLLMVARPKARVFEKGWMRRAYA